jgi:hypothetical protein
VSAGDLVARLSGDNMKTLKPIFFIAVTALAGGLASLPAHAGDASCKPVTDAEAKMARTPYHEVATVDGKPFEKIYTTTALYIGNNGKWLETPATPQDVLDAQRESGSSFSNCKVIRAETLDGRRAIVYTAHTQTTMPAGSGDAQIWIGANGLTLKTVSDAQVEGHMAHMEAHLAYDNVHAPAGVH